MAITKAMTSYKIILGDFNGLPKNQKNMKCLKKVIHQLDRK